MNIKPICVSYNINRKFGYNATEVVSIECEEDFKTRYIDVYLYADNVRNTVDISGSTVTARMVTTPEYDSLLLSDNVACEVAETGHIIIPIDSAVITAYPCDFLVEVHIQNGENVLVLPFPLWVSMRASILDNAGVTPESQGTVPKLLKDATKALEDAEAAIENAGDYEKLENKPQINGHTLSGDKTSDDLGLQKKLTAGQNITIANDGTISAEDGGVTSYNDLTDKPRIRGNRRGADVSSFNTLKGILTFEHFDFEYAGAEGDIVIKLTDKVFKSNTNTLIGWAYDFNTLANDYTISSVFFVMNSRISNLPSAFTYFDTSSSARSYIFHYFQPINEIGVTVPIIRQVIYLDTNGDTRNFIQLANATKNSDGSYSVSNANGWLELGSGGSQIVSGVVNANGTITFTDSDGNTFTTTGASVIGPQGNPGQDYVLTNQDKSDIANIVLGELPTTEGVLYGN